MNADTTPQATTNNDDPTHRLSTDRNEGTTDGEFQSRSTLISGSSYLHSNETNNPVPSENVTEMHITSSPLPATLGGHLNETVSNNVTEARMVEHSRPTTETTTAGRLTTDAGHTSSHHGTAGHYSANSTAALQEEDTNLTTMVAPTSSHSSEGGTGWDSATSAINQPISSRMSTPTTQHNLVSGDSETQTTANVPTNHVALAWSVWTSWSECGATCGVIGVTQSRLRICPKLGTECPLGLPFDTGNVAFGTANYSSIGRGLFFRANLCQNST